MASGFSLINPFVCVRLTTGISIILLMIYILHDLKDPIPRELWYTPFLRVMQDLYHQPQKPLNRTFNYQNLHFCCRVPYIKIIFGLTIRTYGKKVGLGKEGPLTGLFQQYFYRIPRSIANRTVCIADSVAAYRTDRTDPYRRISQHPTTSSHRLQPPASSHLPPATCLQAPASSHLLPPTH